MVRIYYQAAQEVDLDVLLCEYDIVALHLPLLDNNPITTMI